MGQKHSRTSHNGPQTQNPFKLFEYQCPTCKAKRPIQYFYQNSTFLPQAPRVVCGECNTSVTVEPFKTVEYGCPSCKRWQKARMPARPIPLNMYNVSVVSCTCGFRGEVSVGRLMDAVCNQCYAQKRELRDVWAEDGDEVQTHCDSCQDYKKAFIRAPRKKGAEQDTDMEYTCENCFRLQPIQAEELLRKEGLAFCALCGWVGYPEVHPRGHAAKGASGKSAKPRGRTRASSDRPKKYVENAIEYPEPMGIVPGA